MNRHKLDYFRAMSTIPEGFYRTDGTFIYTVGPIVVCDRVQHYEEPTGVYQWSVHVGLRSVHVGVVGDYGDATYSMGGE